MKNWIRKFIVSLGVLLGLFLIINFGINLWIKYKLPNYIHENTDYSILYDQMNVDVITGNIWATHISVRNKNPKKSDILGIHGTMDTLRVNSFSVWDLVLHKQINISDLEISKPSLNIILPQKQKGNKGKKQPIKLDNLHITDGKIAIYDTHKKMFSVEKLQISVQDFALIDDEKTALPFQFRDFKINANELFFEKNQVKFLAKSFSFQDNKGKMSNAEYTKNRNLTRLKTADFDINSWKFNNEKIDVDVEKILLDGLYSEIKNTTKSNKQQEKNAQNLNILVKNFSVKNASFSYQNGNFPLRIAHFDAEINNIKIDEHTLKNKIPISVENYHLKVKNLAYQTEYYNFSVEKISVDNQLITASVFDMKPRYSPSQFNKIIPSQRDLYDIHFERLALAGKWDFFSEKPFLDATKLNVDGVVARIFRSTIPIDIPSERPLYSELLRNMKLPMYIAETKITDSFLEYEEDTPESNGAGKIFFNDINIHIKNINSAKIKGKPTQIPVEMSCKFFDVSPMKVRWTMDTQRLDDAYNISGGIYRLPASHINYFVEPYLKIRTSGQIQQLDFDFNGNKKGIKGHLKMKHKDLKVSLLKDNGEKKKILSAVASLFVKSNSGKFPEQVEVETIPRDNTKSFFNLFWKAVESGLIKTLIGI